MVTGNVLDNTIFQGLDAFLMDARLTGQDRLIFTHDEKAPLPGGGIFFVTFLLDFCLLNNSTSILASNDLMFDDIFSFIIII